MGLPCQPGVWCVSRVLGVLYAQLSSRTTTYISFTSCWRCCFGFATLVDCASRTESIYIQHLQGQRQSTASSVDIFRSRWFDTALSNSRR